MHSNIFEWYLEAERGVQELEKQAFDLLFLYIFKVIEGSVRCLDGLWRGCAPNASQEAIMA